MFRSGILRKPSIVIAFGSLGVIAGHFLYQEYRRRYTAAGDHTTPNDKLDESNPVPGEPASPQQVAEDPAVVEQPDAGAVPAEEDEDDYKDEPVDPTEEFKDVLSMLDLPRLASFATALRITQLVGVNAPYLGESEIVGAACTLSYRIFGSFNIAYEITFGDGLKWIARIPGHGFRFEGLDVEKMNSEYHTMRYIKKNIDLPLPEVIYWSTSTELIGAPFGLISAAEGHPLCDDWQDMTEERRFTVLTDIAGHISKLQQLSFDQIGSLKFSDDGTPLEAGPCLKLGGNIPPRMNDDNEFVMHFETWPKLVSYRPWTSSLETYHDRIGELSDPEYHGRNDSLVPLLHMLVETMPSELLNERRFSLNKPDFALQNIFVNDQGKVTSFIDWDKVSCEDSMGGFATLPLWLCVDWNPGVYCHKPGCRSDEGYSDPSPQQLQSYRRQYSNAMAKALENNAVYDPRMTRMSFVAYAVEAAIFDQWDRVPILKNFMSKAAIPFEIHEYNKDFRAGEAAGKEAFIRAHFIEGWKAGWYDDDAVAEEDDSQDDGEGRGSSEGSIVMVEPVGGGEEREQTEAGDD